MMPLYPYPTQTHRAHYDEVYHDRMNEFAFLQPAYQFGHDLYFREANAASPDEVELMIWRDEWAREEWEKERADQDSTWEEIKEAVAHGWEQAKALFTEESNNS